MLKSQYAKPISLLFSTVYVLFFAHYWFYSACMTGFLLYLFLSNLWIIEDHLDKLQIPYSFIDAFSCRMHDFDDNGKLDGHELLAAMTHAIDHGPDAGMPFEEKEGKLVFQLDHSIIEQITPM